MSELLWVLQKAILVDPVVGARKADASMGEFCTPQMIEEQWEYRDLPRMGQETWEVIATLIKGHYAAMTWARYPNRQVRGQIMVSPAGIAMLKERLDAHAAS